MNTATNRRRRGLNVTHLKSQLESRVGAAPARRYFSCLNLLLSRKLTKRQFDRLCVVTLGRPNLALHNQFIRSLFHNASVRENGELDSVADDLKRFVKRRRFCSSRSSCEADFLVSDEELKRRLDGMARENGLEGGATLECARVLNSGLDLYLRRVIRSCFDLVHCIRGGKMNDVTSNGAVSVQDFRVSMEMNCQQFGQGQDWPLLLERLSCLWFESKD